MPSKYQAVIFDFDGVLVDSEPIHYECWSEVLRAYGVELDWPTYQQHCIGISDKAMLEMLCKHRPKLDFERLWSDYPRKKEIFRERMTREDAIGREVHKLMEQLRPNYRLGLVTSSNQTEVEPILEATGLGKFFDAVVFGNDVKNLKPAPDPYLLAVDRLGTDRALVVEDSQAGIASARSAGLHVLELREQSQLVPEVLRSLDLAEN